MASIYARGRRLYCRLKDEAGRWVSRPTPYNLGQEEDAERYAELRQQHVDRFRAGTDATTVRSYAKGWIDARRGRVHSVADEDTRLRLHVLPHIGDLELEAVRPRHVRDLVVELRKGKLAPRTIRHCYGTLRTLFQTAIREELIQSNPCVLGRDELPKKADKDPAWRATAVFTRTEVEAIISDERIPLDRRVLYALLSLTGCRFGEVAALRWRAYDRSHEPLGALSVHASYCVKTNKEKSVKSGAPRRVPVHPTLAKVLAEWRLSGWARYTGRKGEPARQPTEDDLIIPSRKLENRRVTHGRTKFHEDLDRVGLRARRVHDLRRTFISLALADGARKDVLRWVTHGPEGDIVDLYTTLPWSALCEAVAVLRVERREGAVIDLPQAPGSPSNESDAVLQPCSTSSKRAKSKTKTAEVHGNRNGLGGHERPPAIAQPAESAEPDRAAGDSGDRLRADAWSKTATALARAVLDGDIDRARVLAAALLGERPLRLIA